jgi:hypothetical protein
MTCGLLETTRVVRDEDHRTFRAVQDLRDLTVTPRPVVETRNFEMFVVDDKPRPCIPQNCKPLAFERGGHVAVVVMIAKHRKHALGRLQAGERFDAWCHEATICLGDVVSTENDHVGPFGHDQICSRYNVLAWHELAVMQVGNETNAQPV